MCVGEGTGTGTYAAPNAMANVPELDALSGFWQMDELASFPVHEMVPLDVDELCLSTSVLVARFIAARPCSMKRSSMW